MNHTASSILFLNSGKSITNNHMHSDSKKRRSVLALLFAAGDVSRYVSSTQNQTLNFR